MADKKISQLGAASDLTGVEVFAAVQSSTTKKATVDQLKDYIGGLDGGNSKLQLYFI